jgi:hypothetical protein
MQRLLNAPELHHLQVGLDLIVLRSSTLLAWAQAACDHTCALLTQGRKGELLSAEQLLHVQRQVRLSTASSLKMALQTHVPAMLFAADMLGDGRQPQTAVSAGPSASESDDAV